MTFAYGLIQPADLSLPELPDSLEGLKIAHLSDIHITRHRERHNLLINQLASIRLDLMVLTGDYMTRPGDEKHACNMLDRLLVRVKPKYGTYGVFGNHDSFDFRDQAHRLPVTWLTNRSCLTGDGLVELYGLDSFWPELSDSVALVLDAAERSTQIGDQATVQRPIRLMLCHFPTCIATAADLGMDLVLSGHTHGGQCRLPPNRALVNACDLPLRFTSGLIRHQNTQLVISRGLGEVDLPFRIACPAHVPVYTLHKRPMQGINTGGFDVIWKW